MKETLLKAQVLVKRVTRNTRTDGVRLAHMGVRKPGREAEDSEGRGHMAPWKRTSGRRALWRQQVQGGQCSWNNREMAEEGKTSEIPELGRS